VQRPLRARPARQGYPRAARVHSAHTSGRCAVRVLYQRCAGYQENGHESIKFFTKFLPLGRDCSDA
jgi:hypothetical protein